MKNFLYLALVFGSLAQAQVTVSPNGSSGKGAPPIGEAKKGKCLFNNLCSFQIEMRPYCFGTNLRAYEASTQLQSNLPVVTEVKLKSMQGSDEKVDSFKIEFPATLSYASDGVRQDCSAIDDLSTPGDKLIRCSIVGQQNTTAKYRLIGWRSSTNPSCYANGGSHGQEFCNYAGVVVPAQLSEGPNGIDSQIECLYKFNSNYKVNNSVASCYFPSKVEDLSSKVKVYKDGTELSSNITLKAYTNHISIIFKGTMNSIPQDLPVVNGKIVMNPNQIPQILTSFKQGPNANSLHELASIIEDSKVEDSSAYKTYNLVVKFPGAEGFCGGFYSPLMLFFDKKLPRFSGVSTFPLYGVKDGGRVNWPEVNAPGFFLVHLKAGENEVRHNDQLFGKSDKFENGFEALKIHDSNKDNKIDSSDSVFSELKLWQDSNSNGLSEAEELHSLKSKGVVSIDLKYNVKDVTKFDDRARAREKSKFTFKQKGKSKVADIFDVWLSPID
jgi:hypothetical protein